MWLKYGRPEALSPGQHALKGVNIVKRGDKTMKVIIR